ncbi:MAG TPA: site-specific DNA-methyltransferase [Microscillaceae bacterium]|nr:site-specific DNA-methyltransferase [Microscillaceae bacterium]
MNGQDQTPPTSQTNQELRSRIIGLEMIRWKEMEFIQSDSFKTSTDEQYQKVASSLVSNQFVAPFYAWRDENKQLWCVDGKRRDTVLRQIDAEGGARIKDPDSGQEEFCAITIPEELPALLIDAESKEAAAKLVLLFSSTYGEVSQEGLAEFIKQYDLNFPSLKFEINLPEFSIPRFEQKFDMFGLDSNGRQEPYPEETEEETTNGEAEETIVVQPDDFFEINDRHRIYCGNSLEEEGYKRLFEDQDGTLARICLSDPPYNVKYSDIGGLGKLQHTDFAMASGEMSDEEFVEFLSTYMKLQRKYSVDGSIHGHFIDFRHVWHMCEAGKTAYGTVMPKQLPVWHKSNPGMGSFYRAQHEFCVMYKSGEAKHVSHLELTERIRTNIWEYPSANDFASEDRKENGGIQLLEDHPTPKPVRMLADAILDLTNEGEIVLDSFLGSGSTIVAADRVGRRGFGIELEPKYVQRAIRKFIRYVCNQNKPFEIKCNGKVMNEDDLAPFMPITD